MTPPLYPLDGCRVVDFTTIWAGPQLCAAMSDMGAEVIKVESRMGTDQARSNVAQKSEFRLRMESQRHARGRKYHVTLNLASGEGLGILADILRTADVFVCNLSPKVIEKFGLSYEELRPHRPDLIMATISAAGHTGPWSDLMAMGPAINPVVGSDSLVGYPDTGELVLSYWDPDPAMGAMGFYAIMLALLHREETGEGQFLDLSFCELLPDLIPEPFMEYQMTGAVPGPRGNAHPRMAPHGIYPSADEDSWISVAVATDEEWTALCEAIDRPELATDPRFANTTSRVAHRDELDAIVTDWTRRCGDYEAMDLLQAAGVAAAPALNIGQIFLDPHDTHRRTSIRVETPDIDASEVTYGIPWRLSETPGALQRLARPMGSDNRAFFSELMGMPVAEVERLIENKALY